VVLVKSGHVLLVRRKVNPGKGQLALPGGFLNPGETLEQSAIRELREETSIKTPTGELKKYLSESRTFDYPERSMRGRTITHAFHIKMPTGGDLPSVSGADDADKAFWMPLGDLHLHEGNFFEDHLHIIDWFIYR
jgi:bifunctional NMN adenylyltransferase/nudix hydrolase